MVARLLAQALSNIVTSNELLVARIWETYLGLPEDQVVVMYVLSTHQPVPSYSSGLF